MANSIFVDPSANGTLPISGTVGALLYWATANTVGEIPDVATGQVLASGGVGAAPVYTATPTVTGINLGATGVVFSGGQSIIGSTANVTEIRNGNTPQTLYLYRQTGETAAFRWGGTEFQIWSEVNGVSRTMALIAPSTSGISAYAGGSSASDRIVNITSSGLMFPNDNTHDIGASGATRPRSAYFAASVISPLFATATSGVATAGSIRLANEQYIQWLNFSGAANRKLGLTNANVLYTDAIFGVDNSMWFPTDNLYDIGQTSANRPRTGYFGTRVVSPEFQTTTALVALGGGAGATLGTIGGSGPATAGQNTWLRMVDSTGAAFWVPAWK